jgi:hypothetical protein
MPYDRYWTLGVKLKSRVLFLFQVYELMLSMDIEKRCLMIIH